MIRSTFKIISVLIFVSLASCTWRKVRPVYDFNVEQNITYKTIDGSSLIGDLYLPMVNGLKPAVIVVHGGSWSQRIGDMRGIARHLVRQGFVVFNITYRLAPKYLYPAAVEDVSDAIKWMQSNAEKYNVDTHRIAGWGYSAGSNLVLLAGLSPKAKLKAIVAGGTPANLTAWPASPLVKKFIGGSYAEKPKVWQEASPVNHVEKGSPPVFLYHGKKDDLVEIDQMFMLEKALKEKNVPVTTFIANWGHAGVYVFNQDSIDHGTEFLFKQFDL